MLRERGFFMALTMKITEVHAREILGFPRQSDRGGGGDRRDGDNGEKDYGAGIGSVGSEHRKI